MSLSRFLAVASFRTSCQGHFTEPAIASGMLQLDLPSIGVSNPGHSSDEGGIA